jgi:hypothetical protein
MSADQSVEQGDIGSEEWPAFKLAPTYNPTFLPSSVTTDTDEVVVFDPEDTDGGCDRWVSAVRDSHQSLTDCR